MKYFVLRPFRFNNGESQEAGTFLSEEVVKKEFGDKVRMMIRRCLIIDTEFEYDIPRAYRFAQRRRLLLLRDIGTPEAEALIETAIEQLTKKAPKKTKDYIKSVLKKKKKKKSGRSEGGKEGDARDGDTGTEPPPSEGNEESVSKSKGGKASRRKSKKSGD